MDPYWPLLKDVQLFLKCSQDFWEEFAGERMSGPEKDNYCNMTHRVHTGSGVKGGVANWIMGHIGVPSGITPAPSYAALGAISPQTPSFFSSLRSGVTDIGAFAVEAQNTYASNTVVKEAND